MKECRQTPLIERYLNQHYPVGGGHIFKKWDFEKILHDKHQWQTGAKRWLKLYVVINEALARCGVVSAATHCDAYTGCVENIHQRVRQHRGEIEGGPPETTGESQDGPRRWFVAIKVCVPPFRNYSTKALHVTCRRREPALSWHDQCTSLVRLAIMRGLTCEIYSKLIDPTSTLYVPHIEQLYKQYQYSFVLVDDGDK